MPGEALDQGVVVSLTDMVGGDLELLAELIDVFLAEAPQRLVEAREGIDHEDAALTGRAAHTLKSNALTFGAMELAELARQVETAARNSELTAAAEMMPALELAWAETRPLLMELRGGSDG